MCPAGKGRRKAYQDCSPCSPGTNNDGSQTTQSCTLCPTGYTSSETGATDASGCTGMSKQMADNVFLQPMPSSETDTTGCKAIDFEFKLTAYHIPVFCALKGLPANR